jgi:hypothetical protein
MGMIKVIVSEEREPPTINYQFPHRMAGQPEPAPQNKTDEPSH